MGSGIIRKITEQDDMEVVAAIEMPNTPLAGVDAGEKAGIGNIGVPIVGSEDLEKALKESIELITLASDSRMTLEMEKILKNPYGEKILEVFHQYGFLKYFLPEIDAHWAHNDLSFIREILAKRNERIRTGNYRESISLALSVFAYPSAARWIASAKKKTIQTKAFRMELEDLVSSFFLPRHPTRRAIDFR